MTFLFFAAVSTTDYYTLALQNYCIVWQSTGRAADILAEAYAKSEYVDNPTDDMRFAFYTA